MLCVNIWKNQNEVYFESILKNLSFKEVYCKSFQKYKQSKSCKFVLLCTFAQKYDKYTQLFI